MSSPPPRRDRAAILALLAIIVAIVIVAAAAYVLLSRPPPPPGAPTVDLAPAWVGGGGDAIVNVSAASQELDLSLFRVELRDLSGGNVVLFAETVRPGVLWSSGPSSVRFSDAATAGRLGVGDGFVLENMTPLTTYSLTLVYAPEDVTLDSVTILM